MLVSRLIDLAILCDGNPQNASADVFGCPAKPRQQDRLDEKRERPVSAPDVSDRGTLTPQKNIECGDSSLLHCLDPEPTGGIHGTPCVFSYVFDPTEDGNVSGAGRTTGWDLVRRTP